jgi:hypothetical protein
MFEPPPSLTFSPQREKRTFMTPGNWDDSGRILILYFWVILARFLYHQKTSEINLLASGQGFWGQIGSKILTGRPGSLKPLGIINKTFQ